MKLPKTSEKDLEFTVPVPSPLPDPPQQTFNITIPPSPFSLSPPTSPAIAPKDGEKKIEKRSKVRILLAAGALVAGVFAAFFVKPQMWKKIWQIILE